MASAMITSKKKYKIQGSYVALVIASLLCIVGIFFYFFFSPHSKLSHAKVMDRQLSLTFKVPGFINSIVATKGQSVKKGSPLITLDDQKYAVILKEEEAKLTSLEALLPAGHASLYVKNSTALSEETYNNLLAEESDAKQAIVTASESQAKAALVKVRKQSLFHQGKILEKEYDEARALFLEEEKKLAQRRAAFEEVSKSRALAEKEISRIRIMQRQSGVDAVPAEARIKAYDAQLANVELAASNLEATKVVAPSDGTVLDIFVSQGMQVNAGQLAIIFRQKNLSSLIISGELEQRKAASLQFGQKCEVIFPSLGTTKYIGQIVAFVPKEDSDVEVHVLVNMSEQNHSIPIEPDVDVIVTILD